MCILNDSHIIPRAYNKDKIMWSRYCTKTDDETIKHTKIVALFPSILKTAKNTF